VAERINAYAEAPARTTTSSTTVGGVNKARLTHTPGDNETWLYFWDVTLDNDGTTSDVLARFRNSTAGVDWGNANQEPHDTQDRMRLFGIKAHTYGASPGSQDIDVDFWSESALRVVGAQQCHIFGMKASADDKAAAADSDNTNATTTWETAVTLTETLSGDCLFICTAEINVGGADGVIGVRAVMDSTNYNEVQTECHDSTTWKAWAAMWRLTGLSGSKTATIEFRSENGTDTATIRNARIFAIKLGNFANNYYDEDRTRDTNNTSTPEDQSVLTFTPAAARNHIAFVACCGDSNDAAEELNLAAELDGTDYASQLYEIATSGEEISFFAIKRDSLSVASHTYKTQKWTETNGTVGCYESVIAVLDLEAATAGTVFDHAVQAQTSPAGTLVRLVAKALAASSTPAANVARAVAKPLQASTAPPASLARQTGKPLSSSSSPLATLSVSRLFALALAATTTPVAALVRQAGRVLGALTSPASALLRSTGKPLAASTMPPATVRRSTGKPLAATTTPTATVVALKAFLVTLLAATAPLATLVRQTVKPLAVSTSPSSTLARAIGKVLAALSGPLATLFSIKVFTVALQASASAVATLVRSIGKPLAALTLPVSALLRQTAKSLAVPVSAVSGLVRGIAKALAANAFVAALLDRFPFAPAKVDPKYLLVAPARIRDASRWHALTAGESSRGAADVHVRGLVAPAKDRNKP
jgi:hypothetical protein